MTAPRTHLPLAGRRIVVTRPRGQARVLCDLLEAEGAEVVVFPTIRLAPPADYGPLDRAILGMGEYHWVVFTSQNGVIAFFDRMRTLDRDIRALGRAHLAAIGPGTAGALRVRGLRVDLAPAAFHAEALVEAFGRENLHGTRVLLPRAEAARNVLPDGLRSLGAMVDVVAAYRTEVERGQDPRAWAQLLEGPVDAVTFTSSSTVRNFIELLGPEAHRVLSRSLVACIGPVTAASARECGLRVGIVAETYTIPGLAAALRTALGSPGATVGRSALGGAAAPSSPRRPDMGGA